MAQTVFSAGRARSSKCCRMSAAVLLQVLALSSVCARTSVRQPMSSAARKLSQEDEHKETSFVELLGTEPPLEHLTHLYIDSGSSKDAVSWLLDATRDGCSAAAVEEDPHAFHDHRRKLMEHAGHGRKLMDHDHDEEEHDHAEEEEHDHGSASVLSIESLVAATANLTGDEAKLESAMGYILACQADASCMLEEEHEDEEGSVEKLWALKMGLAVAFLAITILASFVPVLFKGLKQYSGILSLLNVGTGAIFLTVGIVHLLPEVVEFESLANLDTDFPVGFAMVVTGFCLVLFVEHVMFPGEHSHGCADEHYLEECENGEQARSSADIKGILKDIAGKYRAPMIMQLAILVHATLESIAVGLASPRGDVLLLFAAITAHKPFDSLAVATRLYARGCSVWLVHILLLPSYIVPFIGVVIGTAISSEDYTTVLIFNGLTVGVFCYVGGFEVLCEEFTHEAHVRAELDKVRKELEQTKVDAEDVPALATNTKKDRDWHPSKPVKFLAFVMGVGLIFLFTSVLPGHVH